MIYPEGSVIHPVNNQGQGREVNVDAFLMLDGSLHVTSFPGLIAEERRAWEQV